MLKITAFKSYLKLTWFLIRLGAFAYSAFVFSPKQAAKFLAFLTTFWPISGRTPIAITRDISFKENKITKRERERERDLQYFVNFHANAKMSSEMASLEDQVTKSLFEFLKSQVEDLKIE